jgi:hypothetical protein
MKRIFIFLAIFSLFLSGCAAYQTRGGEAAYGFNPNSVARAGTGALAGAAIGGALGGGEGALGGALLGGAIGGISENLPYYPAPAYPQYYYAPPPVYYAPPPRAYYPAPYYGGYPYRPYSYYPYGGYRGGWGHHHHYGR